MLNPMILGAIALSVTLGGSTTSFGAVSTVNLAADPTIDEVFDACVKAMGGRKAIGAIKSVHVIGEMSAQGMQAETEMKWSKAGGRHVIYKTPYGDMESGSDGKVGWRLMAGIYQIMTDEEREELDNMGGIHMLFADPKTSLAKKSEQLEYLGTETFNNESCHKIYKLDKDGSQDNIYFSVSSGLPVGFESISEEDEVSEKMLVSDWKTINDVKFFHTLTMSSTNAQQGGGKMTFSKIEVNTLEDDSFVLPEKVKELAAEEEKAESGDGIQLTDLSPAMQEQARQIVMGAKQAPGTEPLKQMIAAMEPGLQFTQGEEKKMMQYVVQELKKELAKRGG